MAKQGRWVNQAEIKIKAKVSEERLLEIFLGIVTILNQKLSLRPSIETLGRGSAPEEAIKKGSIAVNLGVSLEQMASYTLSWEKSEKDAYVFTITALPFALNNVLLDRVEPVLGNARNLLCAYLNGVGVKTVYM